MRECICPQESTKLRILSYNCNSKNIKLCIISHKVKFMVLKRKSMIKPISKKIKEVTFTCCPFLQESAGRCSFQLACKGDERLLRLITAQL